MKLKMFFSLCFVALFSQLEAAIVYNLDDRFANIDSGFHPGNLYGSGVWSITGTITTIDEVAPPGVGVGGSSAGYISRLDILAYDITVQHDGFGISYHFVTNSANQLEDGNKLVSTQPNELWATNDGDLLLGSIFMNRDHWPSPSQGVNLNISNNIIELYDYDYGPHGSGMIFSSTKYASNPWEQNLAPNPLAVPEPTSMALMGLGLGGLLFAKRKRKSIR